MSFFNLRQRSSRKYFIRTAWDVELNMRCAYIYFLGGAAEIWKSICGLMHGVRWVCVAAQIIIKRKTWALSHYAAASKLAEIIFARHSLPLASFLKYSARLEFGRSFFRGQSDEEKRAWRRLLILLEHTGNRSELRGENKVWLGFRPAVFFFLRRGLSMTWKNVAPNGDLFQATV